jgi:hypothetical protein
VATECECGERRSQSGERGKAGEIGRRVSENRPYHNPKELAFTLMKIGGTRMF